MMPLAELKNTTTNRDHKLLHMLVNGKRLTLPIDLHLKMTAEMFTESHHTPEFLYMLPWRTMITWYQQFCFQQTFLGWSTLQQHTVATIVNRIVYI